MLGGEKRLAIVQSSYIPWKGYFDLIALVDEFILYDDVQYTRRDWRNRNLIKTPQGPRWLTIPINVRGKYTQRIDEALVSDPEWGSRHWKTISHNYSSAPHFDAHADRFSDLYRSDEMRLSEINRGFIEAVCAALAITTKISRSADYEPTGARTERLLDLCIRAGATRYVSGPAARSYLDEGAFDRRGIEVSYMDYSGYPQYPQLFPPFDHHVTILDLLFNTGSAARRYMKMCWTAAPTRDV